MDSSSNDVAEPATLPRRFKPAAFHVVDDFMDDEFQSTMFDWLTANRLEVFQHTVEDDHQRLSHDAYHIDRKCEFLAPFRAAIMAAVPEGATACRLTDFAPQDMDIHASLHHHGAYHWWHSYDGTDPWLEYQYFLQTEPKRMTGGEIEFAIDGQLVAPKPNRLVFLDPAESRRIRRVECWSEHGLDGRVALYGWVRG